MSLIDKAAVGRIVVFLLAWVNQFLTSKGLEALPVVNEEDVAGVITFVVSIWVLIKDNRIKKITESSSEPPVKS